MAIFKVINGEHRYFNDDAIENAIHYIYLPFKARHGFIGGAGVAPECPAESMQLVSQRFGKLNGVQLRHYIISFAPHEMNDPAKVNKIACEIAGFIGREYQVAFAVHEDKPHLHIHFIANAVSYIDGHRCKGTRSEFFALQNAIKQILRKYGIYELRYQRKEQKENSEAPEIGTSEISAF